MTLSGADIALTYDPSLMPAPGGVCGDGICDAAGGETNCNCPIDCGVGTCVTCGNAVCDLGETIATCPADCTPPCGDGVCDAAVGETAGTCPADCNNCGNGVCDAGENNTNCPADCPNNAPDVTITGPSNGHTVVQGTNVTFTGTANDAQDGDISATLDWASDITGSLATDTASFSISNLSIGTHTVTASTTDSQAAPGSDSIMVTVTPLNLLPNPSFEDGTTNPDPWLLVTKGTNLPGTTVTWDCTLTNAHTGNCAIHLTTTYRLRSRAVVRTDLPLSGPAGDSYELSAWIKGVDIYKPGKVQVIGQVFHTDGTNQWFKKTVKEVEGDFDWMQFSKTFTTAQAYNNIRVYIRIWKIDGGEIWVDDVFMTQLP